MYLTAFNVSKERYEKSAFLRIALSNNSFLMHREIQAMFSKDGETGSKRLDNNVLFMVEKTENGATIFIQSDIKADVNKSELFSLIKDTMNEKDMDEYYNGLSEGDELNFKFIYRPTVQIKYEGKKHTKRRLMRSKKNRYSYVTSRLTKIGFETTENDIVELDKVIARVDKESCMSELSDVYSEQKKNKNKKKKSNAYYLNGYEYRGNVRVRDIALIKENLRKGIGPSKSYGFGMMLLF